MQTNIYCHCDQIYTIILFCKLQSNYQTKDETCKELISKGGATIFPGSKIFMYTESCKYLLVATFLMSWR